MSQLSEHPRSDLGAALRRGVGVALATMLILGTSALSALAYWTAAGVGVGSAVAGTLTDPGKPVATVSGATVTLAWTGSSVTGGGSVSYAVWRSGDAGGNWAVACPAKSALTCTDAPGDGHYLYRVTAAYASWTGQSPVGDPVTVDTIAPVLAVTSVNGSAVSFPFVTSASLVSVGGTCGTASGDVASVSVLVDGVAASPAVAVCSSGSWSLTLTTALSADGTHTVAATQVDAAGNTGTAAARSVTVDKTAPAVAVTSVNGTARAFPYWSKVNVTSLGGTCGTASGDVASVSVFVNGSAASPASAVCSSGSWSLTLTTALSAEAGYSVSASQVDSAGNTGSATARTVTIDKTAPVPAVTSVNGSAVSFPFVTSASLVSVGGTCGTASGDGASVSVLVDGSATSPASAVCSSGSWSLTLTTALSADGTHTVAATQVDAAGNTGTAAARSVTVDKTAPAVAVTSVNGTARAFPYWSKVNVTSLGGTCGTASGDVASVSVFVNGSAASPASAVCSSGSWSLTLTTALSAEAGYSVSASQVDSAGNTGSATARTVTIDKTAPVPAVTSITLADSTVKSLPASVNQNVTVLSGTCGTASGDVASVSVSVDGSATSPASAVCSSGSWSLTLTTALSADGTHTISATQTDAAANTGTAASQSVTIDQTAPVVSVTSVNGTARTFPYSTTANMSSVGGACGTASGDVASVTVTIKLGATTVKTGAAACSSGSWSLSYASTSEGDYTVSVSQLDSFGNVGNDSDHVFVDRTTPSVAITSANGSARTFPFTTNSLASIGGTCGTATGDGATVSVKINGSATTPATATCSSGTWTLTLATAISTAGSFSVVATQTDAAGNTGTSATQTVTVDTTAPTVTVTKVNNNTRTFPYAMTTTMTSIGGACGTATGDLATVSVTINGAATTPATTTCTSGSWTLTLTDPITAGGTYQVSATQADVAGNTGTASAKQVTITAPTVSSVTLANGGTSRVADENDTVAVQFSTQLDATTICSSWSNGFTQTLSGSGVTVTITENGNSDRLTVTSTTCALNVGSIDLGTNYVSSTTTFSGSGSRASAVQLTTGGKLTITLGTQQTGTVLTGVSNATPTYNAASGITSIGGVDLAASSYAGSSSRF